MKGKEEEKRNKKWSASKAAGRMGGGDGDVRGDTTMCVLHSFCEEPLKSTYPWSPPFASHLLINNFMGM